jgi:hypothetical protein
MKKELVDGKTAPAVEVASAEIQTLNATLYQVLHIKTLSIRSSMVIIHLSIGRLGESLRQSDC